MSESGRCFLIALLLTLGSCEQRTSEPPPAPGSQRLEVVDSELEEAELHDAEIDSELQKDIEALEAIGYISGSQPATLSGVTRHDAARTRPGLNFVVSGHAPEAVLMDMSGKPVHVWRAPFSAFYPKRHPKGQGAHRVWFWRAARLLPNGDLIVIFEGLGIGRIDKDSRVLWANERVKAHHEADVDGHGDVWVLSRKARRIPRIHRKKAVLEDFISVLDGATGKLKRQMSLIEAYEGSPFADHFVSRRNRAGDVLHTNALEILDGRLAAKNPAFAAGNVLVSMKNTDSVAIVDPATERVVWSVKAAFRHQHDPGVQPDGSLLLFDNRGPKLLEKKRESRIVQLDPATGKELWTFRGSSEQPFYSRNCGTVRRLDSGHLVVTETDNGRVFELDDQQRIVWEYYNPHGAGPESGYVAAIFDLVRLPAGFGAKWRGTSTVKAQ